MNILFICTGNTCRSPMAEAILKHQNQENVNVKSAGIFAADGEMANPNTINVLKENAIEIDHSSKMLDEDDISWATYVFTMTSNHKQLILQSYPFSADKTFTLKEFVHNKTNDMDISDPYGGSVEVYRTTYLELKSLIQKLIDQLT